MGASRGADPMDAADESGAVPRTVEVPLRRLDRWIDGFAARHGECSEHRVAEGAGWQLSAADGSAAFVHDPPWLELVAGSGAVRRAGGTQGQPVPQPEAPARLADLAALRPRFGVLLVRRAGYAVAAFDGEAMAERKVGSRHIHGRTAAGGWSQQRYARRRANQADEIVGAAGAAADRILAALAPPVRFLVTGGDRPLLSDTLAQVTRPLRELPVAVHLGIGTPDAAVLAGIADRVISVRVEVREAVPATRW
jgi:hypothetical protein